MIRIYGIPNCPYCSDLKEKLTKDNIPFVDVNVMLEENKAEYDKIYEITKCDDVPIVKVGKNLLLPNTSFKSINECCEIIKKFTLNS